MGLIRASIIMFLFRMKDHRRRIRYPLHAVFWFNMIYSFGSTLTNVLQCTPRAYAWDKPAMDTIGADGKVVLGGKCIDSRTFVLTSCTLSIFMDLIIIPIPSIMVWNLQMTKRTKVLVVIVMSLGWIATGVSVGRFIVYYYRFAPTNTDRTWNIGLAISIAEPAIHIMCACAPATKCLFRYLFPQYRTEQDNSYYEDRTVTTAPKHGSRLSRALGNFSFGPLDGEGDNAEVELEGAPRTAPLSLRSAVSVKDDGRYDLKAVESFESRDLREQMQRKMSCSKTACTEASEPVEVEPKHCLGQAR
jgi:structural maintenance of chromosome 2